MTDDPNTTDDEVPSFDSPEEALAELREYGERSIITIEAAEQIADAFGVSLPDPSDHHAIRPIEEMRAMFDPEMGEQVCVGVGDLLIILLDALGREPDDSAPYLGTGRNAQHRYEQNFPKLEDVVAEMEAESPPNDDVRENGSAPNMEDGT